MKHNTHVTTETTTITTDEYIFSLTEVLKAIYREHIGKISQLEWEFIYGASTPDQVGDKFRVVMKSKEKNV